MARITSLAHWLLGGVGRLLRVGGRWIARKCISLCYLSFLISVMAVDATRACVGVCTRLKNGKGWHGVQCELRQFHGRQKDRLRGLTKHGWRASSLTD